MSDQLQSKSLDFASATSLVLSTKETLQELRTNESWEQTYTYIKSVADLHGIDEFFKDTRKRKRPSRRIQDSVLLESVGHRDSLSCSDCIKIDIYFPVLDHALSELEHRFSNCNLDLMRSVDACNPLSPNFLNSSLLSLLTSLYNICTEQLPNECLLPKPVLKDKTLKLCLTHTLIFLPLQAGFPTINKLMHVVLTLVVSTAQCERSF